MKFEICITFHVYKMNLILICHKNYLLLYFLKKQHKIWKSLVRVPLQTILIFAISSSIYIKISYTSGILAGNSNQTRFPFQSGVQDDVFLEYFSKNSSNPSISGISAHGWRMLFQRRANYLQIMTNEFSWKFNMIFLRALFRQLWEVQQEMETFFKRGAFIVFLAGPTRLRAGPPHPQLPRAAILPQRQRHDQKGNDCH